MFRGENLADTRAELKINAAAITTLFGVSPSNNGAVIF